MTMRSTAAISRFAGTRRPLHGFTLIEVLVVISVIAILVALLFPGVRAALWSSKSQTSRITLAQFSVAIELFKDMRGYYPVGSDFANRTVVSQLGDLLKVRESSFIDTDNDRIRDAVVDAWGRPFIYTRYVADITKAPQQNPGQSNGENGVQPINNPRTFDLFSCGAFAELVVGSPNNAKKYQTDALVNDGKKYTHDGERVKQGAKETGDINRYIGNW